MADLLSHVLLAYAGCTVAGWYRPIPSRWTAVVMIGAILPDLNRGTLLVGNGTLEAALGMPFDLDGLATLGGAIVLAGIGAMVVADRHRRAFVALLAGALSHLLVDAVKAYADGAAGMWLYPFAWVRHPTPSLYVSSDPAVLAVAISIAVVVVAIDRYAVRTR
ncbi:metal-dependent hydrolase [Natrinema salaciae]|uniref:LexA-binding, inner membrane-associated putative hydrolase n=1 Tax=Natrinema salaciae TaxID=1186196 RepID=A0A1H8ZXX2_9EURY|nr:metal-dependent hydrolase [Natrinema salaciae]SEP69346.1 LexA-binding, inner membrane-associated putative hydrolase [Natrinema salaciae]